MGFFDIFPTENLEAVPISSLRLLRLLRVFRVAKAVPRLRSIVDALIASFSSVGWVCVLLVVINYITGLSFFVPSRSYHPVVIF